MYSNYGYLALITVTIGWLASNEKSNESVLFLWRYCVFVVDFFSQLVMQLDKNLVEIYTYKVVSRSLLMINGFEMKWFNNDNKQMILEM